MNQKEKITRRNAIEEQLQYKLDIIIEKIKLNGIKDTNVAQNRYGNQVNIEMRAAAQQAYQLGIDEVTQKKKTVGFLSTFDTETIKKQVEKYAIKFWLNVHEVLHRNDVLMQKYSYEPRSELNSNYMATKISIALVTTSLALAVKQKAIILQSRAFKSGAVKKKCPKGKHWDVKLKKCVDDDIATPSAAPFPPEPDPIDLLSPGLGLASFLFGDDEFADNTDRIVLVWNAILDQNTCPVCESLDGTRWLPDDPDLPTPGDEGDIHYNCRCYWDTELESEF